MARLTRLEVVEQILTCTSCELHAQCTAPVPMHGKSHLVALGEAPGETEDLQGQPFIGPAGKLLQELLDEFHFPAPALVNTVSCYPHGTPTWDHMQACDTNKWTQIEHLDPQFVLLLGRVALKGMRPDLDLKRGRARPFKHRDRICFATYHPAAALRNGTFEQGMRSDLEIFRELIDTGRDGWMKFIPHSCSACPLGADWFEADAGLGWCPVHLPASERAAYDARQELLAREREAARERLEKLGTPGGGYVGRHHPDTSVHAAATVKANSQQAHLLILIVDAGERGLTCYEATQDPSWETIRPNIAENQVAARRLALFEQGLVTHAETPDGEFVKRPTRASFAHVHVATPAGAAEANRLRPLMTPVTQ